MGRTRTVTVLFSDLVGSTELRATLGDSQADELLHGHHQRQSAAVAEHAGTVVRSVADRLMAVFDSSADAVGAAAALHETAAALATTAHVPLALRVGISAGDAAVEDGDWFGAPVVEAERLCAAADVGHVLVSDLVRQLSGTRTALGFRPVGALRLKGLKEPVTTHELDLSPGSHVGPRPTGSGAAIRACVVGPFAVFRDGQPVEERELGSRKARLLLKALAARRGHLVAMDDLIDLLWGEDPPARAEANVATLVSRLRGVLGQDAIQGGRAGYRLGIGSAVELDVDTAEALAAEARQRLASQQPALALTAASRALELLGAGRALEDEPGAEWAMDLNRQVARLLRQTRAAAWEAHAGVGDHRSALLVAQAAVDADVLDEEAHRVAILSYHRLDEQGEALRAYERLRTVLVEELGANPSPETEALFAAVLRGEAADADVGASRAGSRSDGSDFVGRDELYAELLDRWSQASRGRASCLLLMGEAGIGKTRLAAELADAVRATGATVLRARCYAAERSLFLQPIVELIREAVTTLAPSVVRRAAGDRAALLVGLVPEMGQVLGMAPEPSTGSEIERRRTFEAVAALIGGLARASPVLLVIDDLHEAGASTVELLHFVLRWEPRAPFMVAAAVRTEEGDDLTRQLADVSTTVAVPPLSEDAIRTLAHRSGVAEHTYAIASKTRGHTLFVVEALRTLAEADGDTARAEFPVPASLREAVTGRVRRCGPDVEEVLRAAVVVGAAFAVSQLVDLLDVSGEEIVRRAEVARRAGLLVETREGYEFSNDLLRDVLYETTPQALRAMRHRRLMMQLADQPEAAAAHAAAVGDHRLAVTYWLAAAERAAAAFANREADDLLSLALDRARSLDDAAAAGVLLARGRVRLALGWYALAGDDLSEAEELARAAGDDEAGAIALTERAWGAYHARDIPRAESLAERAAAHPLSGPRAAILVGRVRDARGNIPGSLATLEAVSAEATDPADRALALSCLGTALAHGDRYEEALPVLEEAVAACRRTGVLRGMLNARMFGGIVLANQGHFAPALKWAEQLLADVRRFDAAFYHPRALNILALVWRELGEPERAHDLAEEALETSTTPAGETEGEPAANALVALAESALHAGDESAALEWLDQVTPLLSDRVGFAWRVELRRLDIRSRIEAACAEELLVRARKAGAAKYEALALAYLGSPHEAFAAAQRTASAWLLARVAPEPVARRSVDELAGALPLELRDGFVERGPLLARWRQA